MSSTKRWRQLGGGELMKWETAGQEVEGTWEGTHDGKFGPMGTVRTGEGSVTFPLHTALIDKLDRVRPGVDVKVVYLGEEKSKAGRMYKSFQVFVDESVDDPMLPRRAQADEGSADDADIPF